MINWEENKIAYWINLKFDFATHKTLEIISWLPKGYITENSENECSIPMKNVEIIDCSENDLKNNKHCGHMAYRIELDASLIPNYIELFSLMFNEWGN